MRRYVVLGLLDGIITAVSLTSGLLVRGHALHISEALSIAVVVATINSLTSFIAEYSHQRDLLRDLEYKVYLKSTGHIFKTLVHRRALFNSARSSLYNFLSSAAGALSVLVPASVKSEYGLYALAAVAFLVSVVLSKNLVEFGEWLLMVCVSALIGLAVGLLFPLAV